MPALRRRAAAAASGQANDRFSGVYVHSNPPRVFKSPKMKDPVSTGLGFKKSNIRIWIHNMNIKNLQQVVWEGCGSQLLVEPSNNPKVKRFLETIPHMMGMIRDIHVDVQNDDLESIKNHVSPPVPPVVLSGKDQNGLTALHKAAGLGRHEIAEFIVGELPGSVNAIDNEGRTPLHYSVLIKDNNKMFDFLLQNGASESALDNRQKAAAYYRTRHSEIDSKVLNIVPDCPRSGKSQAVDWSLVDPSAPSANGIKGSEGNLSERSNKGEKASAENQESQKRLRRSQNLEEEEINNNESKNEEPTINTNGNHDEENTILDNEDDKPKENGEKGPVDEIEETATNGKLSKESSLENGDPEDPSSPRELNNENNTEDPEKDEEINNETENNDENNIEEPENTQPQAEEKEEQDKTSTNDNINIDEEDESTQNEEIATEGSRTRPSSKNFLQNSRQNSSAKSEKSNTPGSGYSNKENGDIENGEGVIEGIVNGENEVEPVNNEGLPRIDNESVTSLIKNGNMEQLAALVLNGEGEKLVGQKSDNAELQSFLDNVPVYMNKIHAIHLAARSGNLRELQAALDRRKFAVARDNVSPNGATPLHVAVAFGRTSIVRYLAGRFPETLQVEDDLGRIPLHYAAMLRDNGHYYNLLVHLGSDTKSQDKNGLTPEYYMKHPNEFNHKKLLDEFGAAKEESDEILKDQVRADKGSARKPLDDEDMLGVLERCYNVLQGSRRDSDKISTLSKGRIEHNSFNGTARNHITRYIFDEVKTRLTKLDHNLYDIIWPSVKKLPTDATFREALDHDFPLGIVAPDFYVYDVFQEFLDPIIKACNRLDPKKEIGPQPESKFRETEQDDNIELDLDPSGKWVMTGMIECTRNLVNYELPLSLNIKELEAVERLVTNILMDNETTKILQPKSLEKDIKSEGGGTYYTMNEILEEPSQARLILATNNLLIPLWNISESERLYGRYWPYGRGVFLNTNKNLAVYVNILDHIRIVTTSSNPGNIGHMYTRLCKLVQILEKKLTFRFDKRLGFLTSRPNILGCAVQFRFTLKCPYLAKQSDKSENLKYLCNVRGLSHQQNSNANNVFNISNQQTVGISELQCFNHFASAVANLIQLEKDVEFSNSIHLAKLFLSMFRKRREPSSN